jgi:hypothetical protein
VRTVSFQGPQLSESQRRMLELQRRPFLNPNLSAQVNAALDETEARKAAGVKPARLWTLEKYERGTPYVGDIFNHYRGIS